MKDETETTNKTTGEGGQVEPIVSHLNFNMELLDFINIIKPEHDRTSCSDSDIANGFYSRNGQTWHGRCTRCMYLEIADNGYCPSDFDPDECYG